MVLIVDDHLDNGLLLARLLKTRGHEAIAVSSGRAGLSLLSSLGPDLHLVKGVTPWEDVFSTVARYV